MMSSSNLMLLVILGLAGPSPGDTTFFIANETSTFTLMCVGEGLFQFWLLHGKGQSYSYGMETDTIEILQNGSLKFKVVRLEHEGTHVCMTKFEQTYTANQVPMRVRPKPSTNLWADRYQSQFVIGLIAALVCASSFTLACLVYKMRWRAQAEDKEPIVSQGYSNMAIDLENDFVKGTKM